MKQKAHKIFWQIGQEITPDTFIHADNYICSQHNLIRRLIAHDNYGLLPPTKTDLPLLAIQTNLNNRDLSFERLVCYGTTKAGYLIESESGLAKKHLSIPDSETKTLYIVLQINPFEQVLIEPVTNEEAPAAHAAYELNIRELDQVGEDELAILKIDNSSYTPVIDPNYIPPCMSINACPKLLETHEKLKQLLTEIMSHIKNKGYLSGAIGYPLRMLYDEFDDFSLLNMPIELIRLMKKIARTYQFFIPDVKTINIPDWVRIYNHNDISITFKSLLSYLQSVSKTVSEGEEDFTPQI